MIENLDKALLNKKSKEDDDYDRHVVRFQKMGSQAIVVVVMFFLLIILFNNHLTDKWSSTYIELPRFFLLSMFVYSLVELVSYAAVAFIKRYFLEKTIVVSCCNVAGHAKMLLFFLIITVVTDFFLNTASHSSEVIFSWLFKVFQLFLTVFFCVFLEKVLMEYVKCKYHKDNYSTRIYANDKVMEALKYFRKEIRVKCRSIDSFAVEIMSYVNRNKIENQQNMEITRTQMESIFGRESTNAIFQGLDKLDENKLNLDELVDGIEAALEEKSLLIRAFMQGDVALRRLDMVLNVLALIGGVILYIFLLTGESVKPYILNTFGAIASLSFVFGGVASNFFTSVVYIFGVHLFDTGDRVLIDNECYVVKEIGLLFTTFIKNKTIVYWPNKSLCEVKLANLRRSSSYQEIIPLKVVSSTTQERLNELKDRLITHVKSNPKIFAADLDFYEFSYTKTNISFNVIVTYKQNSQDIRGRFKRSDSFRKFLHDSIMKLEIQYSS